MLAAMNLQVQTQRFLHTTADPRVVSVIVARASWLIDSDDRVVPLKSHLAIDCSDLLYPNTAEVIKESDLTGFKPCADILFVLPEAVSVDGNSASAFQVVVKAGSRTCRISASGPRVFYRNHLGHLALSESGLVESVELRFASTFGGTVVTEDGQVTHSDERNPVGRGLGVLTGYVREEPAPQVWWTDEPFSPEAAGKNTPAALTPTPRSWLPRRCFAGTYNESWKTGCFPFLPKDFDCSFYNSANRHLQVSFEDVLGPIKVTGMSAAPLQFTLGRERLLLFMNIDRPETQPMVAPIDTLIISPATRRIDTIWRLIAPAEWCTDRLAYGLLKTETSNG